MNTINNIMGFVVSSFHFRLLSCVTIAAQVGTFYRKVLTEEEKIRLCKNIAGHLKDAQEFIQKRAVSC